MIDVSSFLPDDVFSVKPLGVCFYDYDEVVFGRFLPRLVHFFRMTQSVLNFEILTTYGSERGRLPFKFEVGLEDTEQALYKILSSKDLIADVYDCRGFYIWGNGWAACASRDLEVCVVGCASTSIFEMVASNSIDFDLVINDIVSRLVVDFRTVEEKLYLNYVLNK